MKSILMGVACVLGAAACAIPYLAMREQYDFFNGGRTVKATVLDVKTGRGKGWAKVRLLIDGKSKESRLEGMSAEEAAPLRAGQAISVLQHRRVPDRVKLRSTLEREKPSILFLVGATLAFLLGVYCFLRPWLRRRRRAARTDPIEMVLDALKRTRWLFAGVSVGLIAFAGFLAYLLFFTPEGPASTGGKVGAALAVVGVLAIAAFTTLRAIRLANPRQSALFQVIERHPERIRWIYHTVVTSYGVSGMTVNVWLADGGHHPISVSNEDADDLLAEIARRAPDALVGYTPENQSRYKAERTAAAA